MKTDEAGGGQRLSTAQICAIDPMKDSSIHGKIFITFDTDWCHAEVLEDTVKIIKEAKISSTVFATGPYEVLLEMGESDQNFEVGIHPNILSRNITSAADFLPGVDESVSGLKETYPGAKSVRSHSLISGSPISQIFKGHGLTHESNTKSSPDLSSAVRPYFNSSGLVECPISWGDFADIESGPPELETALFATLNFHPIHVFLNTRLISEYQQHKELGSKPRELLRRRRAGFGAREALLQVIEAVA